MYDTFLSEIVVIIFATVYFLVLIFDGYFFSLIKYVDELTHNSINSEKNCSMTS